MSDFILHNPQCNKSTGALALIQAKRPDIQVVEYLKTPPPSEQLAEFCRLGGLTPRDLVRADKLAGAPELGVSLTDERDDAFWLKLLHDHPDLMQRPLIRIGDRVVIARPAELVLPLLEG